MGVTDITSAMPLVSTGKVRALAVASAKRLPGAPDIPTAVEQGVTDFTTAPWNGAMAPAGVPQQIVDKLSELFVRIMAMPETIDFFALQNVELMPAGQAPMRQFQLEEIERWKHIASVAKIEKQ